MKAKFISTAILLLMIGLLKSDATFAGYSIIFTPDDEESEYYDPETYLCDTTDYDTYPEPTDDPKHFQMNAMYGAFKIITNPKGADINLYDADMYLSDSPTPVYPVIMDESMELREGIPGRTITLMITKKGYKPMKKDIFVPFLYRSQERALDNPSVFKFDLKRDRSNSHVSICFYYSYANRHHRYRHHHNWFGPPSHSPWCPPGYIGWFYPPRPPHHPGGGNHGDGHPGDGHHGGGYNPPPKPWDGGEGSHGDYPPHHNWPFPPPTDNGNTTPNGNNTGSIKPQNTQDTYTYTQVVHAKPEFDTKPDLGTGNSNVSRASTGGLQTKPDVIQESKPVKEREKPGVVVAQKPNPGSVGSRPAYQEKPKPKPEPRDERPVYQEKPKPKPVKDTGNNKPVKKENQNISKPKPKNEDKQKTDEEPKTKEDNNKKLIRFVKA